MEIEEQIKANQCTKEELERVTEERIDEKEVTEMSLLVAIRNGRKVLTLEDVARILKESMAPEELASILRILLIKEN